jgi:protein required for attachment to host cells
MTHRRNLLYVLADGAHARFVEQSAETHAFVTSSRMDGTERLATLRAEQRDEQAGRTFESATGGRHAVGREDPYRPAKEAFAADVAERVGELLARHPVEGVVLVAPPRLLRVLRAGVAPAAQVVAELGKDLTKTPDHELGQWLLPIAQAPA